MTTPDTLYLEVDEEIPSVIEKLRQHSADDVVLVVPAGSSLVQSVVNIKLLKRAAEKAKKRLALVTTDPIGRHIASQVGVPVFVSAKDRRSIEPPRNKVPKPEEEVDLRPVVVDAPAGVSVHHYGETVHASTMPPTPAPPTGFNAHVVTDEIPEEEPTSEMPVSKDAKPDRSVPALRLKISSSPSTPNKPRRRRGWLVAILSLGLIGVLAALWYFYPRAVITLTVVTEPYRVEPTVVIDSSKQFISDPASTSIVGEHPDATAEATKEVAATGSKDAGTKAAGTASLQNRLGQAVKLSSGTNLVANAASFTTKADVTIPAATATVDGSGAVVVVPGEAIIDMQASQAGETGNVASGTSFTVSGVSESVASKVSGTASAAFSGGTTKKVTVVAQVDIDQVKRLAEEEATNAAKQKLSGSISGQKLLEDATRTTVVSNELSAKLGDEADKIISKSTVKAEAIVFAETAAREALVRVINQSVPAGKMLVLTDSDPVTSSVTNVDWSAGTFVLKSEINTTLAAAVDRDELLKLVTGKSIEAAEAALAQQSSIQRATFTFRPGWLKRLPSRASAIELTFTQSGS